MLKFIIDDITWNDLSMDKVYENINTASSSVGREYLKRVLKTLLFDEHELKKRSERASYFQKNSSGYKKTFKDLGVSKKISLYDYIFKFNELKSESNLIHYILILLLLLSIALIFINPVLGIIALVVMFAVNIATYFRFKAKIESYFQCFKYIVKMLSAAGKIVKEYDGEESLSENIEDLRRDIKKLAALKKGSWLITNSVSGSLTDVILDYVRMLFHVDIIKFNNMKKIAADNAEVIDNLYCTLGEIEADICIAEFRNKYEGSWVTPSFGFDSLKCSGVFHPLVKNPVKNDIDAKRPVLLTGSNASGKSTFLKTIAINQIFAQTLFTCLAESFCTKFYKVISSMALSDNILNKESYFIVEIKSLKRIFDEISEIPVLCFVDEVLRGTNTKERIAASSAILKKLSEENTLCFAATHDMELTEILKDVMDNYHFEEHIENGDVGFDYVLKPGPSKTRNAIKLLDSYGFDKSIIGEATAMLEQC